MRPLLFTLGLSAVLVFSACASDRMPANLAEPEFNLRQVEGQAFAARHEAGAISVKFQLDVHNRSSEPLTLDRVQLESMGYGAYTVPKTDRPFAKVIRPHQVETVDLWIPAVAENTIEGSNGPVTLRGTAYFKSPVGNFQRIFVQQVNAGSNRAFTPE
ncbi:MAG: hypothetical protein WBX15_12045 [Thermoanaerobaculia bacterium]